MAHTDGIPVDFGGNLFRAVPELHARASPNPGIGDITCLCYTKENNRFIQVFILVCLLG